jgi:hypothetical protein
LRFHTTKTHSDTLPTPTTALRKAQFAEREIWNIEPRPHRRIIPA